MATNPWPGRYATGTATVEQGDTLVTFQAAGAIFAAVGPGDFFGTHVGVPIRILETGPATGLTANQARLEYPWRGPAQTASIYEISFTPYDSGYRQWITEFRDKYSNGPVASLADLAIGLDQGIVGTGPGILAAFPLTPFARTLLDDANQAAMLGTLGLLPVQSNTEDATTNRLMRTGAFGLGSSGLAINAPNALDQIDRTCWTRAANSDVVTVNGPPGALGGVCLTEIYSAGLRVQTYTEIVGNGRTYKRIATGTANSYGPWKLIFSQRDIVGPVTVASGIPTGAIIERGSNANGEYVRFADGLQICLIGPVTLAQISNSIARYSWSFPANFIANSYVISARRSLASADYLGTIVSTSICYPSHGQGAGSTNFDFVRSDGSALWDTAGRVQNVFLQAVGRWF